jgi:integrase
VKPKGSPLYPHPLGYWSRKVGGKLYHFGRWGRSVKGVVVADPGKEPGYVEALAEHNRQFPEIAAGRVTETVIVPRAAAEVFTVRNLCNAFLESKLSLLDSKEIAPRTFAEYRQTTDRLIEFFGRERAVDSIKAGDFERFRSKIAETYGPVRLGNEVVRVRSVFRHSRKADLVPPTFKKPSAKVLRTNRASKSKRLFSADEIRSMVETANPVMKAMVLLGINAAFGNSDCSDLSQSSLDLKGGWVDYPRNKTGIERRCKLWPETVAALREAIALRPEPRSKDDADCVFLTSRRNRFVRTTEVYTTDEQGRKVLKAANITDEVGPAFGRLLTTLEMKKDGINFYSLRHTFRTVADASKDFPAVRLVMGHVDSSIDAVYRESIEDERLVAVANFVRNWLFSGEKGKQSNAK